VSTAERRVTEIAVTTYSKKGRPIPAMMTLCYTKGLIQFIKSPYEMKDEIKKLKGARWSPDDRIWTATDCFRNRFQLGVLEIGVDKMYAWFDCEVKKWDYERPLREHQKELADAALTRHFQIWAAEMGLGKTLAAIEVMEKSSVKNWWYVGPKKVLEAIKREFKTWALDPSINVKLMTYEGLTRLADEWKEADEYPLGLICDESTRVKADGSLRTQAAQFFADLIRYKHGYSGYVLLMTGTPSPKTPVDWWAQCEIAFPGFLAEGSDKAFRARLAFMRQREFGTGGIHNELLGWKDNTQKCNVCGEFRDHENHDDMEPESHPWEASANEVADLYDRLKGLVIIKHKKDCLDLPEKQYRKIICKPTPSTLRVAQALMSGALNAVTGLTLCRELSDGFQYREQSDGTVPCPTCNATGEVKEWYDPSDIDRTYSAIDMLNPEVTARLVEQNVTCPRCDGAQVIDKTVRTSREVPCPKEDVLVELLAENEAHGRIVVFAGFTGSVDRCVNICVREGWNVVRCDGRGFSVYTKGDDGKAKSLRDKTAPLDYWADRTHEKVAFVAHPESGGMGLTLTEASMVVFWSNSFKPEYRTQSEDRIHRMGMDENRGATVVDLVHLPTDARVLEVIKQNRKLELLTMGEVAACLDLHLENDNQ